MDGDYPTYFNTGTAGAGNIPVDARYLDSPGAKAMTAWYKLFAGSRHWELEPYFDVDGGRAVAIPEKQIPICDGSLDKDIISSVEYIVYVEKPRPGGIARGKPQLRGRPGSTPSMAMRSRRRKATTESISPARRPTTRTIGCCTCRAKVTRRAC